MCWQQKACIRIPKRLTHDQRVAYGKLSSRQAAPGAISQTVQDRTGNTNSCWPVGCLYCTDGAALALTPVRPVGSKSVHRYSPFDQPFDASRVIEFARALKPYWSPYDWCRYNHPSNIFLAECWQRAHHDLSTEHARSCVESTSSCFRSAVPAKVLTASICPFRPQDSAKAHPSVRKHLVCDLQGSIAKSGLVAILRKTVAVAIGQ